MLFLIVVEGLSGLVRETMIKGMFKGYKVGNENLKVSFLEFADDELFLGGFKWSKHVDP